MLFVQKWNDNPNDGQLCKRQDDYRIFFATMSEPTKNSSGDKVYVKSQDGNLLLDIHQHLIVRHDLFNHDGLTQDVLLKPLLSFVKKRD